MDIDYSQFGLGRRAEQDPRNDFYPMRALLPPLEAPLPEYRYWVCGKTLNQGSTPSCVGHAWRALLEATPVPVAVGTGPDAITIYREAQERDPWPGSSYDGTTVQAGADYLKEIGFVAEYRWANSMADVIQWVLLKGPVVIGIPWLSQMFTPDGNGVVHAAGNNVGGHAVCVYGYHQPTAYFRFRNSWGAWSQRGSAWIFRRDLEKLLFQMDGEAAAPSEVL